MISKVMALESYWFSSKYLGRFLEVSETNSAESIIRTLNNWKKIETTQLPVNFDKIRRARENLTLLGWLDAFDTIRFELEKQIMQWGQNYLMDRYGWLKIETPLTLCFDIKI